MELNARDRNKKCFLLLRRICVTAIHGILCEPTILTLRLLKTKKQNILGSESDMHVALSVYVAGCRYYIKQGVMPAILSK
jgi:hypothetical protein